MFEEWKETNVMENWRDVWFNQVYVVSEKIWNVWECQQVIKKYKCLQKEKRKIIDTTKIRVDIVLERKRKEVEKNKSKKNTWV